MKVYLHLADGFEEIEAVTVVDVLRRADIEVVTVSIMGKKEVTGSHQIQIKADELFEDVDYKEASMIILPGGGPGTKALDSHAGLKTQLMKFYEEDKWIAAICAAPTVLGKLGMLEGRTAICYPGCEKDLKGANTNIDACVAVDAKIITSRGPGTSLYFALKIVEVFKGAELADTLKKQMIIG